MALIAFPRRHFTAKRKKIWQGKVIRDVKVPFPNYMSDNHFEFITYIYVYDYIAENELYC